MLKREGKAASRDLLQAGQMIRARRVQLGLTLQRLGEMAGLSPAFISLVERNKAVPSLVSLVNLARALEVNVSTFMEVPAGEAHVRRRSDPQQIEVDSPVEYHQLSACMRFQQMPATCRTPRPSCSTSARQACSVRASSHGRQRTAGRIATSC